ncbi:MAG: patatin-like phospholipase family protein [Bacteroidales bacterium]|nr:patatin-like phospholipase family protein [Bacteroidales bacterium]
MKNNRLFYIPIVFLLLIFLPDLLFAQDDLKKQPPKLGLVLSGGGAKGFAHVGVLKVLEEAGLQFDYIGGTSMGSIVGALYSLGYHPDSIARIVYSQDWNSLMKDKIPRNYIPIEEKYNFDRFIVTFPIIERRVKVKGGLHNGQLVDLLLAKYLSPAYKTNDFSQFQIPFVCIATDLEDGSNVVLNKGILHKAVRASMSIPGYFSPVTINNRLLVDGGVINNFPVREVKEQGADFIIGVDVQTGLHSRENLNSILNIIDQITSFYRMNANEEAVRLADIYIKPSLKEYDMMSFEDYDDIMRLGEESARTFLPQLKKIADSINAVNPRKPRVLDTRPVDSVFVTYIQYNGLKRIPKEFLDGALEISPRSWVHISELTEGLKRAYGSGFFESINYHLIPFDEDMGLVFTIREASSGIFGAGIHYDSDYKTALLLNATFKNVAIKGSKLFIDLNLGENQRLQGLYLVDRGSKIGFGTKATFFNMSLNEYNNNEIVDVYNVFQNTGEVFAQWTFKNTMRFRAGFTFENISIKSRFSEQTLKGSNPFLVGFLNWSIDTYNRNQYPTKGNKLNLTIKNVSALFDVSTNDITKNSLVFLLRYDKNIPVKEKHTFKPGLFAGFTIKDHVPPPQHWFLVGGQSHINYFDSFVPFTGLRFIENAGLYSLIGNFSWQYNFYPKLYLTAKWDMGFVTETLEELLDKPKLISGFGLTVGYETAIGPVEISVMGSNISKGMSNFINIGYWF